MKRGNLNCTLNCSTEETQYHIFQTCKPVLHQLGPIEIPDFSLIYGTPTEQKCAIKVFLKIDDLRKQLQKIQDNLPPGGVNARTRADTAANTTNVLVED